MREQSSYRKRAQILIDARRGIGDPALVANIAARDEIIAQISSIAKERRYAVKLQQKIDRALESYVRINYTNWNPEATDAERKKANAQVSELIKGACDVLAKTKKLKGKDPVAAARFLATCDVDRNLLRTVEITEASRAPSDDQRKNNENDMLELARELPVATWVESVNGAGLPGLALIVAEAGAIDREAGRPVGLDGYANPAKLWKRLGFAPYDGCAGSTWKREKWRPRKLTKQEWIEHPFSGPRYATMRMIAESLFKKQWIGKAKTGTGEGKPSGPYGEVYAKRRKHTAKTHPEWTKQHSNDDALRVMMKQFLVDLWCQWIDSSLGLGQWKREAQFCPAEIAAAGQKSTDAQVTGARGGTKKNGRGHQAIEAHRSHAATARPAPRQMKPRSRMPGAHQH